MCGELRYSQWVGKGPIRVGKEFPDGTFLIVEQEKLNKQAFWNGFAREESIESWKSKGWKEGYLRVDSYTEQGKEFSLPAGHNIRVLTLLDKPKVPVVIITRPAKTDEEKSIHGRWPVTTKVNN